MRQLSILIYLAATASMILAGDAKRADPADLNFTGMDGRKVHLRDHRGSVVVLNFWATWCIPCREEMPMMVEAAKTWAPKGVVFVGASLDDRKTQKNIPEFLEKFQVTFPVWTGATADDLAKLRMGNVVPDTAFLDAGGVIFARVRGEIRRAELDERLAWATGDRKDPAPEALVTHLDN